MFEDCNSNSNIPTFYSATECLLNHSETFLVLRREHAKLTVLPNFLSMGAVIYKDGLGNQVCNKPKEKGSCPCYSSTDLAHRTVIKSITIIIKALAATT